MLNGSQQVLSGSTTFPAGLDTDSDLIFFAITLNHVRRAAPAGRGLGARASGERFGWFGLVENRPVPAPSPAAYHGRFRLTLARARAPHQ